MEAMVEEAEDYNKKILETSKIFQAIAQSIVFSFLKMLHTVFKSFYVI